LEIADMPAEMQSQRLVVDDVKRKARLAVLFDEAFARLSGGSPIDPRGELKESFRRLMETADRLHTWTTDLLRAFPPIPPAPVAGTYRCIIPDPDGDGLDLVREVGELPDAAPRADRGLPVPRSFPIEGEVAGDIGSQTETTAALPEQASAVQVTDHDPLTPAPEDARPGEAPDQERRMWGIAWGVAMVPMRRPGG